MKLGLVALASDLETPPYSVDTDLYWFYHNHLLMLRLWKILDWVVLGMMVREMGEVQMEIF